MRLDVIPFGIDRLSVVNGLHLLERGLLDPALPHLPVGVDDLFDEVALDLVPGLEVGHVGGAGGFVFPGVLRGKGEKGGATAVRDSITAGARPFLPE